MDGDCYRHVVVVVCCGEAEAQADTPLDIKEPSFPGAVRRRGKSWRIVGIFQHGWSLIIAALLNNLLLPVKPGRPEAWPRLSNSYEIPLAACVVEAVSEKIYTCKPG